MKTTTEDLGTAVGNDPENADNANNPNADNANNTRAANNANNNAADNSNPNADNNNADNNNPNEGGRRSIAVVIVEGNDVMRRGLREMVNEVDEVGNVRAQASVDDTVRVADDESGVPTEVLVMSLEAREAIGTDIAVLNGLRTLVIVPSERDRDIEAASRVNADGYLMVDDLHTNTIRRALLDICTDRQQLPACMASYLLRMARDETSGSRVDRLSPREQDVYQLVITGCANKEIASSLGISIHGVKRHVSNILSKHNSPSRAHLVATVLSRESA